MSLERHSNVNPSPFLLYYTTTTPFRPSMSKLGQKQIHFTMQSGWNYGHFSFHTRAGKLVRKKAAKPIFYATVLKCRERNWLWWNAHEMHQMCVGWGSREAKVASLASVPPWLPIQKRSKSWFKVERNWAIVFHTPVLQGLRMLSFLLLQRFAQRKNMIFCNVWVELSQ